VNATYDARHVAIAAGVFSASSALETPPEDFTRILAVNLIGVFGVAQGYARMMRDGGGGAIVGVASIAATMPRMRQAAYCASKAGVRQALRVLGMETAPHNVRVNTVSPGPTDTPMMRELARDHPSVDHMAAGSPDALRPPIPAGRVARPADVAAAVAFLLSPNAAHITLRDLVVDGGELLGA
jgi:2,3-dihydro-2,3-dihydroxybenzoate dehydrogenase